MKELCPNRKSELVTFSASIQESLDKGDLDTDVGTARIHDDGKITCIIRGSSIEIVNLQNGRRLAALSFESIKQDWEITCFCPYENKYLVTLSHHDSKQQDSLLCVYDPAVSRVIKAMKLNYRSTSLCLIKDYGGAGDKSNFISEVFQCMFGIAAIGTEHGHLYIVDLRGDDKEEQFSVLNPSELLIIDPSNIHKITSVREIAHQEGKHCCIDLNYNNCTYNGFRFCDPNTKLVKMIKPEKCSITALKFLPQTLSLAVGYQFGCHQLWSMETFHLLYGNSVTDLSIPVTHFTFQEPDDDPRSCCYLWVGKNPSCSQSTEYHGPTTISLYQILYEDKELRAGYGQVYKGFECVIKRFAHQLTADAYHLVDSHSPGSRIISFKTIGADTSLCYVTWETCMNGELSCHLGIFDINRWYQKQLPGSLRDAMYGRMEAVCPFFAFYSLTDIAEEFLPNAILDVHIDTESMNTFKNIDGPQSEQFYWPSSFTFSLKCVSEASSVSLEMLGIQRQIIADTRRLGTESFVDAQDIVQNCWVAGLFQNTANITRSSEDKRNTDALLSIHLAHDGTNFITNCIKKWSHGSITHAGHSMKLIYDWAWNHVIHVKKNLDQLYLSLFSTLSACLETEHGNKLKRIAIDLGQLADIFRELQRADAMTIQAGIEELRNREKITSYLHLYCTILLVLVDNKLLPEPSISINAKRDMVYPYDTLQEYYTNRRKEIAGCANESNTLFIDVLCKQFVEVLPPDNDSDKPILQQYPPKSIETMCQTFVENCCDDGSQLMMIYYWMLDICECFEILQTNKFSKKFKATLKLSNSVSLLVESLWLLDHKLYKDAVEHLALVESKISSRYYTHIVRTLHNAQELLLLTTFCSCKEPIDHCTFDELKLLIKVFLKLKLLDNAYRLQAKFSSKSKKPLLFNYFVEQCKQNKILGKLVTLSFTPDEEDLLQRILKRSKDIQDYLLVFYLERGLLNEAYNLTKDTKQSLKWQRLRQTNESFDRRMSRKDALEKLDTKGLIVDGFIQTVPSIEQKKLEMETLTKSVSKSTNQRSPLSTVYRAGLKDDSRTNNKYGIGILSTLQHHDISYDCRDRSGLFGDPMQSRRKCPLFDGDVVSPKKKMKESPALSNLSPISPSKQQTKSNFSRDTSIYRKHLFQGADAFLLLSTPPAVRRTKHFPTFTSEHTKTPQSILKSRVKTKIGKLDFTEPDRANEADNTKVDQTPRKIRFIGLSPTSPLTSAENSMNRQTSPTSTISRTGENFTSIDGDLSKEDAILMELSHDSDHEEDSVLNKTPVENILLELSKDEDAFSDTEVDDDDYLNKPNAEVFLSQHVENQHSPSYIDSLDGSPLLEKRVSPQLNTPTHSLDEDIDSSGGLENSIDVFASPLQYIPTSVTPDASRIEDASQGNVQKIKDSSTDTSPDVHRIREASPDVPDIQDKLTDVYHIQDATPDSHLIEDTPLDAHHIGHTSPDVHHIYDASPDAHYIEDTSPDVHHIKAPPPDVHHDSFTDIYHDTSPDIHDIRDDSSDFTEDGSPNVDDQEGTSPNVKIVDDSSKDMRHSETGSPDIKASSHDAEHVENTSPAGVHLTEDAVDVHIIDDASPGASPTTSSDESYSEKVYPDVVLSTEIGHIGESPVDVNETEDFNETEDVCHDDIDKNEIRESNELIENKADVVDNKENEQEIDEISDAVSVESSINYDDLDSDSVSLKSLEHGQYDETEAEPEPAHVVESDNEEFCEMELIEKTSEAEQQDQQNVEMQEDAEEFESTNKEEVVQRTYVFNDNEHIAETHEIRIDSGNFEFIERDTVDEKFDVEEQMETDENIYSDLNMVNTPLHAESFVVLDPLPEEFTELEASSNRANSTFLDDKGNEETEGLLNRSSDFAKKAPLLLQRLTAGNTITEPLETDADLSEDYGSSVLDETSEANVSKTRKKKDAVTPSHDVPVARRITRSARKMMETSMTDETILEDSILETVQKKPTRTRRGKKGKDEVNEQTETSIKSMETSVIEQTIPEDSILETVDKKPTRSRRGKQIKDEINEEMETTKKTMESSAMEQGTIEGSILETVEKRPNRARRGKKVKDELSEQIETTKKQPPVEANTIDQTVPEIPKKPVRTRRGKKVKDEFIEETKTAINILEASANEQGIPEDCVLETVDKKPTRTRRGKKLTDQSDVETGTKELIKASGIEKTILETVEKKPTRPRRGKKFIDEANESVEATKKMMEVSVAEQTILEGSILETVQNKPTRIRRGKKVKDEVEEQIETSANKAAEKVTAPSKRSSSRKRIEVNVEAMVVIPAILEEFIEDGDTTVHTKISSKKGSTARQTRGGSSKKKTESVLPPKTRLHSENESVSANESVLSFTKTEDKELFVRHSKRSSSKRASLAISDISKTSRTRR